MLLHAVGVVVEAVVEQVSGGDGHRHPSTQPPLCATIVVFLAISLPLARPSWLDCRSPTLAHHLLLYITALSRGLSLRGLPPCSLLHLQEDMGSVLMDPQATVFVSHVISRDMELVSVPSAPVHLRPSLPSLGAFLLGSQVLGLPNR